MWFVLFLQCCEGHSSVTCVPQLRTMRPAVRIFLLTEAAYRVSQMGPRAIFRGQFPEMPPLAWPALVEIKPWHFQAYRSQRGQYGYWTSERPLSTCSRSSCWDTGTPSTPLLRFSLLQKHFFLMISVPRLTSTEALFTGHQGRFSSAPSHPPVRSKTLSVRQTPALQKTHSP